MSYILQVQLRPTCFNAITSWFIIEAKCKNKKQAQVDQKDKEIVRRGRRMDKLAADYERFARFEGAGF
jgi:hypothetical protein